MIRITYEIEFEVHEDDDFDATDAEAMLVEFEEIGAKKSLELYSSSVEWEDA